MRYIKTYEQNIELEVGDYVIIDYGLEGTVKDFLVNSIGKLVEILPPELKYGKFENPYLIRYENIPPNTMPVFIKLTDTIGDKRVSKKQIKHSSKNKEDLEVILNANKFNI